jgi:hypothetical protein
LNEGVCAANQIKDKDGKERNEEDLSNGGVSLNFYRRFHAQKLETERLRALLAKGGEPS